MGTFASVVSMNAFLRVVHGNAYEDVEDVEEEEEETQDNDEEEEDEGEASSTLTSTGGCCEDAPYDAYHSPFSCQWTRMARRVVSRVATLAPVDEDDDEDEA